MLHYMYEWYVLIKKLKLIWNQASWIYSIHKQSSRLTYIIAGCRS